MVHSTNAHTDAHTNALQPIDSYLIMKFAMRIVKVSCKLEKSHYQPYTTRINGRSLG